MEGEGEKDVLAQMAFVLGAEHRLGQTERVANVQVPI
jgi:hypothetical protein